MKRTFHCLGALLAVMFVGAGQPLSARTLYTSPPIANSGGMPEIKEPGLLSDGRIIIRSRALE